MPTQRSQPPAPTIISEDLWAAWRSFALAAAIDLDLFSQIGSGKRTPEEIALAISANSRAVERLCDAMTALKYLRKRGDSYELEPIAATYLVRGRELYMEGIGQLTLGPLASAWFQLPEVVKSGNPAVADDPGAAADFFRTLVKAMFPSSFVAAQTAIFAIAKAARARLRQVLDVAAGSAAWSIPFAQALPEARISALDLPQVLEVTREYVERYGLAERYDYIPGDLRELDFGENRYDLVILGHILHGQGRRWARKLIEKSVAALRDEGMLLIAEFVPNDKRTAPPVPLLFGLNMLVGTAEGDVFTMSEYREWLKAAGMRAVKTIKAPHPSPLILARK